MALCSVRERTVRFQSLIELWLARKESRLISSTASIRVSIAYKVILLCSCIENQQHTKHFEIAMLLDRESIAIFV
ncbi:hypothetical protein [Hoylesella nanceiensis]|uniref:hypothetical protein n=1 Tax=Hoylesella nanceiensis TaxID=425941 RepID=UPI0028E35C59|nr:hypothetical protein [Hoylesella nanceiensis]